MTTHAQARQAILAAWPHVFADEPTLPELQAVQAVGLEESHYGDWFNGNWGAIQGGRPDSSGNCPPGTFGHGDTHEHGEPYAACFKLYGSQAAAAQDLIRTVFIGSPGTRWDRAPVRRAAQAGDQVAFDTALRKSGYYELPLAKHIEATTKAVKSIATALGEPIALSMNPKKGGGALPWLEVGVAGLATVAAVMGYRRFQQRGGVKENPYFLTPREAWQQHPAIVTAVFVVPLVAAGAFWLAWPHEGGQHSAADLP